MEKPKLPNEYGGEGEDQAIVTSGRVLFNAKEDFILGFANKGIVFSTNGGFHINGGNGIDSLTHINTKKILLGLNSDTKGEPILMGATTEKWLYDLIVSLEVLVQVLELASKQMWPSGGNSVTLPLNLELVKSQLKILKNQAPGNYQKGTQPGLIHPLLSDTSFTLKSSN